MNIVKWCPYCDQGWILIVKGMKDKHLYCRCNETFLLWKSPEDIELGNFVVSEEITHQNFECASKEEIIMMGWDKPQHRVITCKYCCNLYSAEQDLTKRKFGWIVIKKDIETEKLFCRCETCGRIWLDITSALRLKNADEIQIYSYTDASDDDIHNIGWDKYNNILYLET